MDLTGHLLSVVSSFSEREILIVGDIIADEYIYGQVSRISREAPVLILEYQNRSIVPGGASNTANNIRSLGAKAHLVGVVGRDIEGRMLRDSLKAKGIGTDGILSDHARPTTLKTRILAGGQQTVKQQVVRIDRVTSYPIDVITEEKILKTLSEKIPSVDGVIISDYGLGLLTDRIIDTAISLSRKYGKPVSADSRYNILRYTGVTVVTPNQSEAEEALGKKITNEAGLNEAGLLLIDSLKCDAVCLTRGAEGMSIFERSREITHIPATNPTDVFDVTGAGDTVISALTLALASGASVVDSALISNLAAGLVVRKMGTATVTGGELVAAMREWVPVKRKRTQVGTGMIL